MQDLGRIEMNIDLNKVSKLGFGLMRLPKIEEEIDIEQVCSMVDRYLEAGMNYFDTAYVYHSGMSEKVVKEAIVSRHPRNSFTVATKLPSWEMKGPEDSDRIFNEQLKKTGAGFFDFYLLHSVEEGSIDLFEKWNCFEWGIRKKEEGLIKHFGFSFHGSPELLKEVLDRHPETEFVQIQLNYADWNNPVVRSGELYEILHERNIPMVIMEPVKGGTLASLKPELEQKYRDYDPSSSIASWALRFVASLPGIMTVLSGMSDISQMEDNLKTFSDFKPLNEEEKRLIEEVTAIMLDIPQIGCTSCRYCTDGCPMQINIPSIFAAMNRNLIYGQIDDAKRRYANAVKEGGKASECIHCLQCEDACPQHIEITSWLERAAAELEV